MENYGENGQINFKQFIFLLARFRNGSDPSKARKVNTHENKLKFLFEVNIVYDRL